MGRKKAKGQSGSGQGGAHRAQDPESDGPKVKPRGPANPYDDAPLGLCYFDADLRWVHINEWLAAVNGPPVSDHLGRTIGELLPDLAQAVEGQTAASAQERQGHRGGDARGRDPGQARNHAHVSAQLLSREILRRNGRGGELRRTRHHRARGGQGGARAV